MNIKDIDLEDKIFPGCDAIMITCTLNNDIEFCEYVNVDTGYDREDDFFFEIERTDSNMLSHTEIDSDLFVLACDYLEKYERKNIVSQIETILELRKDREIK